MSGRLNIIAPQKVPRGAPFSITVGATGAEPGEQVSITLRQWSGVPPPWGPRSGTGIADANGSASVGFNGVNLAGPTVATLIASGHGSQGTYFQGDSCDVEVL